MLLDELETGRLSQLSHMAAREIVAEFDLLILVWTQAFHFFCGAEINVF